MRPIRPNPLIPTRTVTCRSLSSGAAALAALAATGPNARWGITIALVHFMFNLSATLLIFPFPRLREIPLNAARKLASIAVESRRWALIYVLGLFYGVPLLFAAINHLLN